MFLGLTSGEHLVQFDEALLKLYKRTEGEDGENTTLIDSPMIRAVVQKLTELMTLLTHNEAVLLTKFDVLNSTFTSSDL